MQLPEQVNLAAKRISSLTGREGRDLSHAEGN